MRISVMNRYKAVEYCKQPHGNPVAIIAISDPRMTYRSEVFQSDENNVREILRLMFSDADRPGLDVYGIPVDESDLMSEKEAADVVDFVSRNKNCDIIVHCDAGISRSAGVAAGIMYSLFGDDSEIFDTGRYRPNMWCYRKVVNVFAQRQTP